MKLQNNITTVTHHIREALALHGQTATNETIKVAALTIMIAEDNYRWSCVLWTRPEDADLRLAATTERRIAIDVAMEPLFAQ